MSATALVTGKLFRNPEPRASKDGKPFVSATMREGNGEASTWWKVLCFSESGCAELMSLQDGDALAISGAFKVEPYEKNGATKLSFTIFVDRLITARKEKRDRVKQRRSDPSPATLAERPATGPSGPAPTDDDEIPF